MSIETRIQAINDHLVDDYKVLRLAGADLTGVNKNIVNLKMSWKERLLYFMNNGTDDVWNNWIKVSGTGTSLSLSNTEEAPMSLTYKGNTSQSGTPTPSSPIPVQVVSGDNSIEVKGKNLFDISKFTLGSSNGITATIEEDHLLLNGTATATAYVNFHASGFNGTCTWGIKSDVSLGNFQIQRTGAGVVNIVPSTSWNKSTLDSTNVTGGYLSIPSGTALTNCKVYVYVGLGTLSSIEYEEYKGASYPISLGNKELCKIGTYQDKIDKSSGKNILNITTDNFYSHPAGGGYATYKLNDDKSIEYVSGSGGWGASYSNAQIKISLPKGTYSVSINPSTVELHCRNSDNTNLGTTFTLTETTNIGIGCKPNATTGPCYIMLNEGTTALPYEPYGTGWYLKKEIGKVVLNGSENWTNPASGGVYQYNASFLSIALSTAYCTHAKQKLINSNIVSSIGNNEFVLQTPSGSTNSILYFRDDTITGNITNWKSWLSSNNVSVYYILATPTYETITDTTLIGQLEAIKKSYEGQTNISQVNNDLPFELDVTALEVMS